MTTIVVIDDQLTSRQILKQLVCSLRDGLEVRDFANPVEAYEWCTSNPVELVLVDYKMPEMNGVEFIHKFRANKSNGHVPVIMVTSWPDRSSKRSAAVEKAWRKLLATATRTSSACAGATAGIRSNTIANRGRRFPTMDMKSQVD